MASSTHIPLPEQFPFDNSAYWDTSKSMFDRYCTVANVATDKVKVDCLLYAMGPRAEEIYNSFTWESENDKTVYPSVVRKFTDYFNGRTNTIYQRALFNRRMQKEGESIDDFITDLHKLAKYCNYGDTREKMIRDKLVVRVRDIRLSEKMQLQDNLNYKKALEMARSYETVLRQNRELHQEMTANATSINRVQSKGKKQSSEKSKTGGKSWKCYFCGGNKQHKRDSCPARKSECNKCSQIGHWSKVCKKGPKTGNSSLPNAKVNAVTDDSDYYFVGTVKENDESTQ
ncbi:uncharacterized protein LOC112460238 [Temnothorax curvispinosus]|uniref:Uncharacterized protein LOC112460238 n=1 Tax=Temnothorax curvispinosus TaxID=300111 RepID=A0A6J1QFM2_9HYME|nr:uncharacterized protein LOC112460238 [Temnothorax curvispinosus]